MATKFIKSPLLALINDDIIMVVALSVIFNLSQMLVVDDDCSLNFVVH